MMQAKGGGGGIMYNTNNKHRSPNIQPLLSVPIPTTMVLWLCGLL